VSMSKSVQCLCRVLVVLVMGASSVWAAKPQVVVEEPLTGAAAALEAGYVNQLNELQALLKTVLPSVDAQKHASLQKSREAEKAAEAAVSEVQRLLGKVGEAQGAIGHAKNKWIGGADTGIAKAQEMLKAAKTDDERAAAQKDLENWTKNREDGLQALKERQAKLDQALAEEPALRKQEEAAQTVLAKAQADTLKATEALGVGDILASSKRDGQLARFVVLTEATPRGLAGREIAGG